MVQVKPTGGASSTFPEMVTVHLVGRLTPTVLSFLVPAIHASSSLGRRQALLYIDDGIRHEQITTVPIDVHSVHIPDSYSFLSRCGALFSALQSFSQTHPMDVLHVHGVLPALAAACLLRARSVFDVEVLFSPHSSRLLNWTVARHALLGCLAGISEKNALRVIANVQREARLLDRVGGLSVQVMDCPVPPVFFETPRNEASDPIVISCNLECHHAAFDAFQRLAVLLNDERLGITFQWMGNTAAGGLDGLRAAGIVCFDAFTSSSFRAVHFSTAWVYVATCNERGFPIRLAEAMAAGLPCVALDTEVHRSIVIPGETGYLYASLREMLERIGQLVDSEQLRYRMGNAARREAELRFRESEFRRRFLHAVNPNSLGASLDQLDETPAALRLHSPPNTPTCS